MEKMYIEERGNGFPNAGAYVPGSDGELYEVKYCCGHIETQQYGSRWFLKKYRCVYMVELADWGDCDEGDEFPAMVRVPTCHCGAQIQIDQDRCAQCEHERD